MKIKDIEVNNGDIVFIKYKGEEYFGRFKDKTNWLGRLFRNNFGLDFTEEEMEDYNINKVEHIEILKKAN